MASVSDYGKHFESIKEKQANIVPENLCAK